MSEDLSSGGARDRAGDALRLLGIHAFGDAVLGELRKVPGAGFLVELIGSVSENRYAEIADYVQPRLEIVRRHVRAARSDFDRFQGEVIAMIGQAIRTPQREKREYLYNGLLNDVQFEIEADDVQLFRSLVDALTLRHVIVLRDILAGDAFRNGAWSTTRQTDDRRVSAAWKRVKETFRRACGATVSESEAKANFEYIVADLEGRGLLVQDFSIDSMRADHVLKPSLVAARFLDFIRDPLAGAGRDGAQK